MKPQVDRAISGNSVAGAKIVEFVVRRRGAVGKASDSQWRGPGFESQWGQKFFFLVFFFCKFFTMMWESRSRLHNNDDVTIQEFCLTNDIGTRWGSQNTNYPHCSLVRLFKEL